MPIERRDYEYTVVRGDNLVTIARKHGLEPANDKAWSMWMENNKNKTFTHGGRTYKMKDKCLFYNDVRDRVIYAGGNSYPSYTDSLLNEKGVSKLILHPGEKIFIPGEVRETTPPDTHNVRRGDSIASIALKKEIHWSTIWEAPENSELKNRRKNPFILYPGKNDYEKSANEGDKVIIPGSNTGTTPGNPNQGVNRYVSDAILPEIRIQMKRNNAPIANKNYSIEVSPPGDSNVYYRSSTTDQDGFISETMLPAILKAKEGKLKLFDLNDENVQINVEEYVLKFNDIDPLDTISGVQARLKNLGFYKGDITDFADEELENAVKAFQNSVNSAENGKWDDSATQQKIKDAYGC
jgi:N-acetylmuramoyl-L-alanine amidase